MFHVIGDPATHPKIFSKNVLIDCPCCSEKYGSNYCGSAGFIQCYCARETNESIHIIPQTFPEPGVIKCRTCTGVGQYKKYANGNVTYRFRFYGKNLKPFDGFIKKSDLSGISASIYYKDKTEELDQNNWKDNAEQIYEATTSTDPNCLGIYYKKDSIPEEFTDYKSKISAGRYLTASNISDISSSWILCTPTGSRNCFRYYNYINTNTDISDDYGVNKNFELDKCWSNFTNKDTYDNDFQLDYYFRTNGMSPTAGVNHTISNVTLNYDIPLNDIHLTGNYLHIATPYVTVFNNSTTAYWCGNITQMIMTWEAE